MLFVLFLYTEFLFAQNTGNWITRTPMPTPRQEIPHAELNGKIYVAGGITSNSFDVTNIVEVFDPAKNMWTEATPMPANLHHHTITSVDGKLYVVGGYLGGSFSEPQNKVYEYDPAKDEWNETAPFPFEIAAHASVSFNGKLYVFGGRTLNIVYNIGYVFDPVSKIWSPLSSMTVPREHLTASATEQNIFVIGGRNSNGNTGTVEMYDPLEDKWFSVEHLPTPRGGLASSFMNGKIYVFGGEIPKVYEENEEYNPAAGTWRTMAPMPTPRHGIGSAVVGDTIFIIGGGAVAGFNQTDINEGFVYPTSTGINEDDEYEYNFKLYQNYPNPFNPTTKISWQSLVDSWQTLKIYDVLGNEVATLVNEEKPAGEYEVEFHSIVSGKKLASGIYFYQLNIISDDTHISFTDAKKLILLR